MRNLARFCTSPIGAPFAFGRANMSGQPATFETPQDIDNFTVELGDETVESFDAVQGVLFGLLLCMPFWAGVYWFVRSL
jgi:hypothetical protein